MLPFIIAGLTTGSVYGLAGVGLVLTYKTSGVFNFAHGALATVSAYLFYTLHVQHHLPWPWAVGVCVFVVGPLLGVVLERIVRDLGRANLAIRVAATIGILLVIQAGVVMIYGTTANRAVPLFLGTDEYHLGSTVVSSSQLAVFVVGVVATCGLYCFFRLARTGAAMRAVVDDADLLSIAGTNPTTIRRYAWAIGVSFASASGVLLVPFVGLDPIALTFLVIAAFGAAALGGFVNLPATYVGGLGIGVLASLATKYFTKGALDGVAASMPFLVLFAVLLVGPRRLRASTSGIVPRRYSSRPIRWQLEGLFGASVLALLFFVPSFADIHLADYSRFLAITIMFLSLGLLVRTSGQISLCHLSFMAIGACAFSHLAVDEKLPWGLALAGAGAIAVPVGALLAIPAIRLSGLYLALATFGFGILLQNIFYTQRYMFGQVGLGVTIPAPHLSALGLTGSATSYYYLVLVFAVSFTGLLVAINKGRLGRLLQALAESPTAAATSGASIDVTRVVVFCISAFIAAVAGALEAGASGQVGAESYQPLTSLVYFALIVISIGRAPWHALAAAFVLVIIPSYASSADASNWLQLGIGALAIAYSFGPRSAALIPMAIRNRLGSLIRADNSNASRRDPETLRASRPARVAPAVLSVHDLHASFGGLTALQGVSLEARTGRITGLIGPNGAGKTTMFNACSGQVRPSRGSVLLDGANLSGLGLPGRARRGLGRSYQQIELFEGLTVTQNVALGAEASFAGLNPLRHVTASPATKRRVATATENALRECGLVGVADVVVGSLSTGQRRLVELARLLAGPSRILLLDEPSAGLDRAETMRLGALLQRIVTDRGMGVLLVEHDVALVTAVCEQIYVLEFGTVIFAGTPAQVRAAPLVRAAYLGTPETDPAS